MTRVNWWKTTISRRQKLVTTLFCCMFPLRLLRTSFVCAAHEIVRTIGGSHQVSSSRPISFANSHRSSLTPGTRKHSVRLSLNESVPFISSPSADDFDCGSCDSRQALENWNLSLHSPPKLRRLPPARVLDNMGESLQASSWSSNPRS